MNEFGMLNIIPAIFRFMFAVVIGTFVIVGVKALARWWRNEHSPRLTVSAVVVTKRTFTSRHRHHHTHTADHTTAYYATFAMEGGNRLELTVSGTEYGQLAEGDRGMLSFQGTRYLGFAREGQTSSI